MANRGEQYGKQTDEYGNPIHRPGGGVDQFSATGGTESYANQPGATGGAHGTHGGGMTDTTGAYGSHGGTTGNTGAHGTNSGGIGHGTTDAGLTTAGGGHRRSGSSSSSSSEDDGQGGRRKKGVKDKIKEKLPGGHKDEPTHGGATAAGGGYGGPTHGGTTAPGGGYNQPEKKGVMSKIKDKLPGGGH